MSDVLSMCLEIMAALGQGYCLQSFLGSFLESRCKDGRFNGLPVAVIYGILRIGMKFLISTDYGSIVTVGKLIVTFMIIVMLSLLFYKGLQAITAFLAVTFMAVSEISFFLSYMVMRAGGYLFNLWVWLIEKGIINAHTLVWIVQVTAMVLQLVFYCVFLAVLYFALKRIAGSFKDKEHKIQRTELYFLMAPGMAGLLICVLLRIIMITVENNVPKLLYDQYPILTVIVPAILILSLLSVFYSVKLFQDMIALNREKSSRVILEKQVDSMQEHMAEMERVYAGINSMKHDMKNTLAVIIRLAGEKEGQDNGSDGGGADDAELQNYLSELNRTFDRLEYRFQTGNSIVDTLLNMKYHEAVRSIPDLQMDADRLLFPKDLLIHGFDIGIILGNALDNAVEACKKLKEKEPDAEVFIRLSSFQKGKMFFLEIENSFDGKLIRKRQSEFPATDKADQEAHGIGLVNIKNAAEKYRGGVDWSAENYVFTLTVMMQNEERGK